MSFSIEYIIEFTDRVYQSSMSIEYINTVYRMSILNEWHLSSYLTCTQLKSFFISHFPSRVVDVLLFQHRVVPVFPPLLLFLLVVFRLCYFVPHHYQNYVQDSGHRVRKLHDDLSLIERVNLAAHCFGWKGQLRVSAVVVTQGGAVELEGYVAE